MNKTSIIKSITIGVGIFLTPIFFNSVYASGLEFGIGYGPNQNTLPSQFQRFAAEGDIDANDTLLFSLERQTRFNLQDIQGGFGFRSIHKNEWSYGADTTLAPKGEFLPIYAINVFFSHSGMIPESDLTFSLRLARYITSSAIMIPVGIDLYQIPKTVLSFKLFPGALCFDYSPEWRATFGGFARATYELTDKISPSIWLGASTEPQAAQVIEQKTRLNIYTAGIASKLNFGKFSLEPQTEYTYRMNSIFRTQWLFSLIAKINL